MNRSNSRLAGLADLAPPPAISEALSAERARVARYLAGEPVATRVRIAPPAPSTRTVRRAA